MKKSLAILFTVFIAISVNAYVPTSKTILARTARTHGKGAYVIDQDVTIQAEGEPIVLRERWTVLNSENMKVSVTRRNSADTSVKLDIVYRGGKRSLYDSQGAMKTVNISSEFIEPYFFFRTSASMQAALIKSKVVPANFGQQQRRILPSNPKDSAQDQVLKSMAEPHVQLSRTGGVVNYALGTPGNSGIWIEQDAFVVRKIKFPSQAEVQADQHVVYPNQLKFPKERTIHWGNYTVTAKVVSIRAATESEATASLKLGEAEVSRVPEINGLKEFYSRFR